MPWREPRVWNLKQFPRLRPLQQGGEVNDPASPTRGAAAPGTRAAASGSPPTLGAACTPRNGPRPWCGAGQELVERSGRDRRGRRRCCLGCSSWRSSSEVGSRRPGGYLPELRPGRGAALLTDYVDGCSGTGLGWGTWGARCSGCWARGAWSCSAASTSCRRSWSWVSGRWPPSVPGAFGLWSPYVRGDRHRRPATRTDAGTDRVDGTSAAPAASLPVLRQGGRGPPLTQHSIALSAGGLVGQEGVAVDTGRVGELVVHAVVQLDLRLRAGRREGVAHLTGDVNVVARPLEEHVAAQA